MLDATALASLPTQTPALLAYALAEHPLPLRCNALLRLGHDGHLPEPSALIALMQPSVAWGLQQGAAWVAGELRLVALVDALAALITDDATDEQVRYVAALALHRIHTPAALAYLQDGANHPQAAIQRAARAALATTPRA